MLFLDCVEARGVYRLSARNLGGAAELNMSRIGWLGAAGLPWERVVAPMAWTTLCSYVRLRWNQLEPHPRIWRHTRAL